MQQISDFLKRFSGMVPKERIVADTLREFLEKKNNLSVPEITIKVSGDVVHIVTHPAIKQHIISHKEEILIFLFERMGNRAPKDIR